MTDSLTPTDRTTVRRLADRGRYERRTVNAILDEAYLAHVGFVIDGQPRVLPMTYGRDGDSLYLHGAAGDAWKAKNGDRGLLASQIADELPGVLRDLLS